MIYNYIDENICQIGQNLQCRNLIDKGALKGNEKRELLLTDVMLRIFVVF